MEHFILQCMLVSCFIKNVHLVVTFSMYFSVRNFTSSLSKTLDLTKFFIYKFDFIIASIVVSNTDGVWNVS